MEGYRTALFYAEYRGRRLSFTTQGHRLAAVKRFTRFLWREHYLLTDPGACLERPRVEQPLPRTLLSEADMETLLLAPDTTEVLGIRDRAVLEVFYSTGVRNAELRFLTLDAVSLEQQQLAIRRGKGGKGRLVPLGEAAATWLSTYLVHSRPFMVSNPQEQTLFISFRGRPLEKNSVVDVVHQAALRAGLPKTVTPHALRLACATHMLARGASLRHIQELLGHASPETTQRYTRVEISDLKSVHRRFHPREQPPPDPTSPVEGEEMP
jgi:integrase/recombinase XerD